VAAKILKFADDNDTKIYRTVGLTSAEEISALQSDLSILLHGPQNGKCFLMLTNVGLYIIQGEYVMNVKLECVSEEKKIW